jgi:MtN3 and saliva related transmembrane protein
MSSVELIGGAAALLTTFCWVPQALRTIRLRDTRAISLPAQLAFAAGLALWLVYGVLIASWPLVLANAVSLGLASVIVATKLRFG